ncbi:MAG: glycine/betaine/sarcosine/D-proline family reductase selenoprotein B, partial [bacterium]
IPVAHVVSIVPISKTVGANRIIPAISIPHPLGDPKLTLEDERALRRRLVETAMKALETPIETQTVFEMA